MKTLLKPQHLIVTPESEAEAQALVEWKASRKAHVFVLDSKASTGLALLDLGPKPEACREPINVWSRNPDPQIQLIGNFAATPFELDGRPYATVEAFWQSLKFDDPAERLRVAGLDGPAAKRAGEAQPYGANVQYDGRAVAIGTWEHWQLMERACWAKFRQNENARAALLATGQRPLVHVVRRDSRTIPGVIMAAIWMRIRNKLQYEAGVDAQELGEDE